MLNQTRSRTLRLSLVLLLTLLTACAVSAMMWRGGFKLGAPAGDRSTATAIAVRKDTQPRQGKIGYIGGHMVWPSLREPFRVMASRLEKPGTELIIFTASLSRLKSQNPNPVPVRLILTHPNQLRLEEGNRVTIFDGSSLVRVGGTLTDDDADEAETLLLDFPERLFVGHVTGNPMSQLGSSFRTDDGSNANYRGPYYDVYKVAEGLSISVNPPGPGNREFTSKRYFINSDTHLLERIVYERRRGNRATSVEIKLDDWRTVGNQRIPFSITRLEGRSPALQFRASAVVLARRGQ